MNPGAGGAKAPSSSARLSDYAANALKTIRKDLNMLAQNVDGPLGSSTSSTHAPQPMVAPSQSQGERDIRNYIAQLIGTGYTEEQAMHFLKVSTNGRGSDGVLDFLNKHPHQQQQQLLQHQMQQPPALGPKLIRKPSIEREIPSMQYHRGSPALDSGAGSSRSDSPHSHTPYAPSGRASTGQYSPSPCPSSLSDVPPPLPLPRCSSTPPPPPPSSSQQQQQQQQQQASQSQSSQQQPQVPINLQQLFKRISPAAPSAASHRPVGLPPSSLGSSSQSPARGTSPVSTNGQMAGGSSHRPIVPQNGPQAQQQLSQQMQALSLYQSGGNSGEPPPPYPLTSLSSNGVGGGGSGGGINGPPSYSVSIQNRQSPTQSTSDYRKSPSSGIYSATSAGSPSPITVSQASSISPHPAMQRPIAVNNSMAAAMQQQQQQQQAPQPPPPRGTWQKKTHSPIIMQSVKSTQVQKPVLQTAIAPPAPHTNGNSGHSPLLLPPSSQSPLLNGGGGGGGGAPAPPSYAISIQNKNSQQAAQAAAQQQQQQHSNSNGSSASSSPHVTGQPTIGGGKAPPPPLPMQQQQQQQSATHSNHSSPPSTPPVGPSGNASPTVVPTTEPPSYASTMAFMAAQQQHHHHQQQPPPMQQQQQQQPPLLPPQSRQLPPPPPYNNNNNGHLEATTSSSAGSVASHSPDHLLVSSSQANVAAATSNNNNNINSHNSHHHAHPPPPHPAHNKQQLHKNHNNNLTSTPPLPPTSSSSVKQHLAAKSHRHPPATPHGAATATTSGNANGPSSSATPAPTAGGSTTAANGQKNDKIKHQSPIPERKVVSIEKEQERKEFRIRQYSSQAYKFYMEQHIENVHKSHKQRIFRRNQLEKEMHKISLSDEAQVQMRKMLYQKESNYIRLKRAKMNKSMFTKIKDIGVGAFGEVSLVRKIDTTNHLYAMKTLRKTDVLKRNQVAHVKAERDILAEADNEWVVKLYYSFQDKDNLYFVMDYIPGGDLMSLLIKMDIFQEPLARFYIAELTCAVESVHKMGFIHRDIKPDNILIDRDGHIKLTDFGLCTGFRWTHDSKYYQKSSDHCRQDSMEPWDDSAEGSKPTVLERRRQQDHQRCLAHSLVGTPNYIAPEVLERSGYTQLCDWWSVGVILYEMLVGQPPFLANTPVETQQKVINYEKSLHIPPQANLTREAADLILRLCSSSDRRLGKNADEVKAHAFFKGVDFKTDLRQQKAPYVPKIDHPTDTSNFDPVDPDRLRNSTSDSFDFNSDTGKSFHGFYEFTFRRFFINDKIFTDCNEDQGSVYV